MTHRIHHVTAIAGDPRRSLDFYARVLGLRLVKRTVNFEDPTTWHLYLGDEAASPGALLTLFAWPQAAPGRTGIGAASEVAFRVPAAALGFWTQRLLEEGVPHDLPRRRFGETALAFRDPDGLPLALVGVAGIEEEPARAAPGIPAGNAIRGLHGATLMVEDAGPTAAVLASLGYRAERREGSTTRFRAPGGGPGDVVDLRGVGGFLPARPGPGVVDHVAFRTTDEAERDDLAVRLGREHGMPATEAKDRRWFRSVYLREPGGVLLELATDGPGFAVDEPRERLGESLSLPDFLAPHRAAIEAALPPLDAPLRTTAATSAFAEPA